jgi:hypothetical protein
VKLGNPRLAEARAPRMRANAEEAARQVALALPVIKPLYEQGLSLRSIARELAARGVPSAILLLEASAPPARRANAAAKAHGARTGWLFISFPPLFGSAGSSNGPIGSFSNIACNSHMYSLASALARRCEG